MEITDRSEKNMPGTRVEDRFSFKREFCYRANTVVNFPASLSPPRLADGPGFPNPQVPGAADRKGPGLGGAL